MGFGFESIASTNAAPFWQSANIDTFSFGMTRYVNVSTSSRSSSSNVQPGGVLTLGGTNASLYQGSINYVSLTAQTYWLVKLDGITVGGQAVSGASSNNVAIDTGTSLIGAPTSLVEAVYAGISGASPASGQFQGYYQFPCSTDVDVAFTFGGVSYAISPDDFNIGAVNRAGTTCIGALFAVDTGSSSSSRSPSIIAGDTFLKSAPPPRFVASSLSDQTH